MRSRLGGRRDPATCRPEFLAAHGIRVMPIGIPPGRAAAHRSTRPRHHP
ncbi:hypothetical protein ACPA9J_10500 [Pseudomonas aeruginosa]